MNKLINILFIFGLFPTQTFAKDRFELVFKTQSPLNFDIELYELKAAQYSSKVGDQGPLLDIKQLEAVKKITDLKFDLKNEDEIYLALVVKNKNKQKASFFVAPHHTNPSHASLDFKFNCLCYHHIYHVEGGAMWYRVMRLLNTKHGNMGSNQVVLSHTMVPWKAPK